ncbi:MAG: sensor histidine kinase [Chloroflexi bacterium]|nr:sensor histidine kinase [Chloroflexota bacterium]
MVSSNVIRGTLTLTERSFRDDIERAMRSDIVRAIVELTTNADDSYTRLGSSGEITIDVQSRRGDSFPTITIADQAEGMTLDDMQDRLGFIGAQTSGFDQGTDVRGLFGRGGKDVVHFGPVSWKSWRNGAETTFEIIYNNGATTSTVITPGPPAPPRKHGTIVALEVRRRVPIPHHANLKELLARHYALRPILTDGRRASVHLKRGRGKFELIEYGEPVGELLASDETLSLSDADEREATCSLWQSPVTLDDGRDRAYWRHSLLVTSKGAAYEVFGGGKFAREPDSLHLGRLFGVVDVPAIANLIRDYDRRAANNQPPADDNPIRLVSRDREGLVGPDEHPFVAELYAAIEQFLEPHIDRLREEAQRQRAPQISTENQRRLRDAERVLSEFLREEEVDVGDDGNIERPGESYGLAVIPSSRIVEPGEPGRLVVRYRPPADARPPAEAPVVYVTVDSAGNDPIEFQEALIERGGYYSKTITVDGREEGSLARVHVRHRNRSVDATLSWRYRELPTVEKLEFDHGNYSLREGRTRRTLLYAPWEVVAQGDVFPDVELTGDDGIAIVEQATSFGFDHLREAGVWTITLRGERIGARARVRADLAGESASAAVVVTSRGTQGLTIQFQQSDIERRAWLSQEGSAVIVNTSNRVIARYLGAEAAGWPGQETLEFRTMLAEILATTIVTHSMSRRHNESRDVPRLFAEYQTRLDRILPRLHGALIAQGEISSTKR